MKVQFSSYKGHPTISLNADSKYPFTFGVEKAKAILEALPQIQDFVKRNSVPARENSDPMGVDRAYEDSCARQCGM